MRSEAATLRDYWRKAAYLSLLLPPVPFSALISLAFVHLPFSLCLSLPYSLLYVSTLSYIIMSLSFINTAATHRGLAREVAYVVLLSTFLHRNTFVDHPVWASVRSPPASSGFARVVPSGLARGFRALPRHSSRGADRQACAVHDRDSVCGAQERLRGPPGSTSRAGPGGTRRPDYFRDWPGGQAGEGGDAGHLQNG